MNVEPMMANVMQDLAPLAALDVDVISDLRKGADGGDLLGPKPER
jgi:hypothetical protein